MATKKIIIETTRTYTKTTTIEVEVDVNLKNDELIDFLGNDSEIDNQIENSIGNASLDGGGTQYNFQDPTENFGGSL